ncbi:MULTISPECIES: DUF222 domain-containing protein [Mycobacterium]|uniref:DUF222 domain-containing protein n=2 Tax=Mycobacterium TaxID=1763 RepID=UPI002591E185|nr:DUF222 domain-containing protein [Mycobacterium sp. FLAC0960]MDM4139830.1 DUF222 domain-containing protein [Mycobacterium sp. FLAC0960]
MFDGRPDAEVFARGDIDFRVMAALVFRSELIEDAGLIARLDAVVARHAPGWMRLSGPKLIERIDMWVARVDAAGLRVPGQRTQDRYVEIDTTSPRASSLRSNAAPSVACNCAHTATSPSPRRCAATTPGPKPSAAPTPWVRWPPDPTCCAAAAARRVARRRKDRRTPAW